jgi:preprotein translocase subunit SecA
MVEDELKQLIATHLPGRHEDAWDLDVLLDETRTIFPLPDDVTVESLQGMPAQEIEALILDEAENAYDAREEELGAESMRTLERMLLLQVIDRLWVEHLTAMDEMRQGIGLQAYAQQDPLVAYKREAHDMWEQLLSTIRETIAHAIFHVTISSTPAQPARTPVGVGGGRAQPLRENRPDQAAVPGPKAANGRKIGRNDPCWCGSGKKFKRCHGVAA